MTINEEKTSWGIGSTAEDFADLVKRELGDADSGLVDVAFDDFTLPDHIVLGGGTELQGQQITYAALFAGATEYFHGIKIGGLTAAPPFLRLAVTRSIVE